jgi:hypothetical protein
MILVKQHAYADMIQTAVLMGRAEDRCTVLIHCRSIPLSFAAPPRREPAAEGKVVLQHYGATVYEIGARVQRYIEPVTEEISALSDRLRAIL